MSQLTKAIRKVEWPTSEEVAGRFGLVLIVLITLLVLISAIDGVLGYLLGYIY